MTLLACIGTAGCDKPSEKAKREYQIMVRSGATGEEKCTKLREIAAAYLSEENTREYQMANMEAAVECNQVLLDSLG